MSDQVYENQLSKRFGVRRTKRAWTMQGSAARLVPVHHQQASTFSNPAGCLAISSHIWSEAHFRCSLSFPYFKARITLLTPIMRGIITAGSIMLSVASGAQPSAPAPVAAPMRDLPWGDLNFLATTDTHGWHAGHLQEPQYSADWGDYISFATRMKERADQEGVDLLLVDTGDRVDGNGLYDGSDPKGKYTYDIFKEQEIDIICTGNHELYQAATAEREWSQTVPNFKGNYLASNLDIIDPKTGNRTALAKRYRKFTTKNKGITVLAFGFLFDFTGNANNTFVQPVEETIKEAWFQEAIREKVDIFVVIGHVALRSEEYNAIYKAIRDQNWDTPIQFFGGHSHIRDYMSYDSKAYALESGRYMETIGWMSIENVGNRIAERTEIEKKPSPKFSRRYIDNNLFGYHYHTGLNDTSFPTEHGQNVSAFIKKARTDMDLDKTYGCAPQDFWLNRAEYPSNGSMFSWLENQVLPSVLVEKERADIPKLAIINTGAVRFDIFKGRYTRDTIYIVCPFQNQFRAIKDVPYVAASKILSLINSGGPVLDEVSELGLRAWMLPPPEQISVTEDTIVLDSRQSDNSQLSQLQKPLSGSGKPNLLPGYTTKDDAGSDGDDTLHDPISFYRVPNCIESKIGYPSTGNPDKVDLIFLDFVQPWILIALRFLGQGYEIKDTEPYREGHTFTHLMKEWIGENWDHDC